MKYVHLLFKEKLALVKYLQPLIHEGSDGFWHYAEGYSDSRVAAEFGKTIGKKPSAVIVANVRNDAYGPIREYRAKKELLTNNDNKNESDINERIKALEARIHRIESDLGYENAAE